MMMRAVGWTGDTGGCMFYRVREKLRALHIAGWDTTVTSQLDPRDGAHVLLTQRVTDPHQLTTLQAMRASGSPILQVADLDDDLWRVPFSSPGGDHWSNVGRQERLRAWLRNAHLVTVTTSALRDRVLAEVGRDCPPVAILPNTVPESLTRLQRAPRDGRPITLGWSGSDSHAEDWKAFTRPVLETLHKHPDVQLQIGGWLPPQFAGHDQVTFEPWRRPGREHYMTLRTIDIGLAPLVRSGLNDCKSPVKALEYAALGIPTVASAQGPYPEFLDGTGICVSSPLGVLDNLRVLIESPELRRKFGRAAKAQAREMTTERQAAHIDTLYRRALRELRTRKVA